jgi:hypothetical protein
VVRAADAHDVDLRGAVPMLAEAEEAALVARGEGRERGRPVDVRLRRLLDAEPLRQVAEDGFRDARALRGLDDLDDHGRPTMRRPA